MCCIRIIEMTIYDLPCLFFSNLSKLTALEHPVASQRHNRFVLLTLE